MPSGTFVLQQHDSMTPLVMVAAGIGVTPIMSMIDFLAQSKAVKDKKQQIICIQVERSPEEHSMREHIDNLAHNGTVTETHVFYTRAQSTDEKDLKLNLKNTQVHVGRPTEGSIKNIISNVQTTAEFYYCGPEGFMSHFGQILDTMGVSTERRHCEQFGPTT